MCGTFLGPPCICVLQTDCSDHYYTQVVWRNADSVMITWSNRVQNESISVIYDVTEATPTLNEVYYLELCVCVCVCVLCVFIF